MTIGKEKDVILESNQAIIIDIYIIIYKKFTQSKLVSIIMCIFAPIFIGINNGC